MDLTALYDTYERMPSEKYASPAIMLKILLYAYRERKEISSSVIEKNCRRGIIERYGLKPLWHKEVRKKHVKGLLLQGSVHAGEELKEAC